MDGSGRERAFARRPVLAGVFHGNKPIPPEQIVIVERGDLARSVVAPGKVEPDSSVGIKSKAEPIDALRHE